jgi:negative regulator of sigma-B (phosphoserine phosphatase)
MQVLIGSAQRAVGNETVCGDSFIVAPIEQGLLLCLADGLGHGPAAHVASDTACRYAQEHADMRLEALMRDIDGVLRGTRGAAVSLLALAGQRARFVGVGNVELRAHARARIAPPTQPGIVGQGVRRLRVWEYPIAYGDLFALVSDGISTRFDLEELAHLTPQAIAEELLAKHKKSHDDACCVIARLADPSSP